MEFQIGDEVEIVMDHSRFIDFKKVTVVCFHPDETGWIGVEIESFTEGHSLHGTLIENRNSGYYLDAKCLRLVKSASTNPTAKYRTSLDEFQTCDEHWNTLELLR